MTAPTVDVNSQFEYKVPLQYELMRKGIHLCSLSIPVGYYYLTKETTLSILIPLTLACVIADVLRSFHGPSYRLYKKIFGPMLRKHEILPEKKTLTGASWILLSACFCVLVFPKIIAITAFAILIISDTLAAIIGRRFGTKKYRDKTLEGSSAFVVSAAVVILFTPKLAYLPGEYLIALIAAIIGAAAEVFSFNLIDDNFSIPVSIGVALWLMYLVFFPDLNVYLLDG